jgi:hypothetical protein
VPRLGSPLFSPSNCFHTNNLWHAVAGNLCGRLLAPPSTIQAHDRMCAGVLRHETERGLQNASRVSGPGREAMRTA